MEYIINALDDIRSRGLYPKIRIIESAIDPEIVIGGKKILMFCSNDYLGLANHSRVKKSAIAAIEKYGVSTCSSRLISGNTDIHEELEYELSHFLNVESSMVFPTGYMSNAGVIPAIVNGVNLLKIINKKTIIISDQLNHASIIDGCRLAKTKIYRYEHRNIRALEKILKRHRKLRKLIVTDGVFSMDGDIIDLPTMIELKEKYNALLMIDEAHSIGVLGKTGRGITEYYQIDSSKVDILMGTLSKAIGSIGGYIAGSKALIDFLRVTVRSYIFTASPLPPASTAAALEALYLMQEDQSYVASLKNNSDYLREQLRKAGVDILDSQTPIIPVMIGDEREAIDFSEDLFSHGILSPCVRWPVVPKGEARIRCVVMANHTREHLDYLVKTIVDLKRKNG